MCGIVGAIGCGPLSPEARERALNSLHHRGPDDCGFYYEASLHLFLGHKRLSIFGITNGHQPIFSEDRNLISVANGELYQYAELRATLEESGHTFSTNSDSELPIHFYEHCGLGRMFSHLNGEFAFALFDKVKGTLILARDRFGIKPLYYAVLKTGGLAFASEAKALFALGITKPRITADSLRDMNWHPDVECPFEGISTVAPGTCLEYRINTGVIRTLRYYDISAHLKANESPSITNYDEAVSQVREAVKRSVKERMQSDVPVGVFLSGGIDSSIVAAEVAALRQDPIKTFGIGFTEDSRFDESQIAKRTADHLGAEHFHMPLSNNDLLDHLEEAVYHYERPFLNLHAVGKFLLSKLAAKHVKVVLTGEGADELFLGYDFLQNLPDPWYVQKRFQFFYKAKRKRPPKLKQSNFEKQRWAFVQLTKYILNVLGDRNEMAQSLEGRPPFLSHHVFEVATKIAHTLKLNDKRLLRDAFKDSLTPEVYGRKKWRFAAPTQPIKLGINSTLDRLISQYMSRKALRNTKIFRPWVVPAMQILQRFPLRSAKRFSGFLLFYILTTQITAMTFSQESPRT